MTDRVDLENKEGDDPPVDVLHNDGNIDDSQEDVNAGNDVNGNNNNNNNVNDINDINDKNDKNDVNAGNDKNDKNDVNDINDINVNDKNQIVEHSQNSQNNSADDNKYNDPKEQKRQKQRERRRLRMELLKERSTPFYRRKFTDEEEPIVTKLTTQLHKIVILCIVFLLFDIIVMIIYWQRGVDWKFSASLVILGIVSVYGLAATYKFRITNLQRYHVAVLLWAILSLIFVFVFVYGSPGLMPYAKLRCEVGCAQSIEQCWWKKFEGKDGNGIQICRENVIYDLKVESMILTLLAFFSALVLVGKSKKCLKTAEQLASQLNAMKLKNTNTTVGDEEEEKKEVA